jgi:cell division initiation protein
MSLTPVEIRHLRPKRRLFGYDRDGTDRLLDDVRVSFEVVWRERADLTEEVERLESELARFRELEVALRNTLVSAERASDELKAQAGREAELMLENARLNAREITAAAENERERLRTEIRGLKAVETDMRAGYRAFLLTALERLQDETDAGASSERAA